MDGAESAMNRDQINIRSTLGSRLIEVHFLCTVVIAAGARWGLRVTVSVYSIRSACWMVK